MQRIPGNFRVGIFLARREEKDLNILEKIKKKKINLFHHPHSQQESLTPTAEEKSGKGK